MPSKDVSQPERDDELLILVTGIMAAGKSTVAQALAERLPKSVHLCGDPRLLDIAEQFIGPNIAMFGAHYCDTLISQTKQLIRSYPNPL